MNYLKATAKKVLRKLRLYHPTPPIYVHPPTPLQSCFDALVKLGFQPQCLIDVGTNHGNWTRTALRYFPDLQVAMVEPQECLRNCVADLLEGNDKLHWVTAGASDEEGLLRLTVAERDDSSNFLLSAEEAARRGLQQVEVRVLTVANLVDELKLPVPDIIKIDAEGLDLKVLEGCGRFLGETDLFFVEASLLPEAKDNAFVRVVEFMSSKGYSIFDITDLNRSPNCGGLCLIEMAFVRNGSPLRERVCW
jgi:FkbM family methyltransferase